MELVFSPGKTEEDMKANTLMIRNMVMANFIGLMVEFMTANGLLESRKALVSTLQPARKKSTENGKPERELDGWKRKNLLDFDKPLIENSNFYLILLNFLRRSLVI